MLFLYYCSELDELEVLQQQFAEIPKSFFIKHEELVDEDFGEKYTFDNGIASKLKKAVFRRIPVALRECKQDLTEEVRSILGLPSHPCLPILLGICCDRIPFLLVTKFYGCSKFGVMLSLAAAIECKLKDFTVLHFISIVQGVIDGLMHIHSNGFCHGNVNAGDIILYRQCKGIKFFQPVFICLDKAKKINDSNLLLLANDVQECASLVASISGHFKETNIFTSVSQMLKLNQDKRSLQVLQDVHQYLQCNITKGIRYI